MKISIAMASYNGEKYIKEQLDSFCSQTRFPDELIITDDCSTDGTEEIVKEFAETAPFAVVFHRNEKNLGYCANFNAALMKTTGDLVFLSDQDDVWFPKKIETMVRLADENPEMLVLMNDTELTDGDLNSVGLTKLGQIKSAGLNLSSYVMGCCCAIRRELLDLCMPIPEGFGSHDRWIVDFASNLEAKLVDPTVLQYYRRHDSNESEFIVNRTVKVSRIDVLTSGIKLLFSDSLEAKEMLLLRQLHLRYEGIRRAITVSPDSRVQLLKEYLLINDRLLRVTEKRAVIRNKRFFARLAAILGMVIEGDYRHSSGIKAIFRDVLG